MSDSVLLETLPRPNMRWEATAIPTTAIPTAVVPTAAVPTKSMSTTGRVGSVHDFLAGSVSVNRNGSNVLELGYSSGNFRNNNPTQLFR